MNARAPLKIIGLENCWENVHPDVIHVSQRFAGFPYLMIFTPYPSLNDRLENPTIRASHDGMLWERIPGMPDPLVPPPTNLEMHHADPELLYHQDRLYVIYLTIRRKTNEVTFNTISCGSDLSWTKPTVIHQDIGAVSPSYQFDEGVLHEWFVRMTSGDPSRTELVRRDGSDLFSLGDELRCILDIPGHVVWHIDIQKVKDGFEAIATAFPRGTDNSRSKLFHLSSKDGLTFKLSRPGPIIEPSFIGWDNRVIHRSSFLKEPDGIYRIWYTGGSWGFHFGIGLLEGLLDSLNDPAAALARVPGYFVRFPGEVRELVKYEARRHLPSSLLSVIRTRLYHSPAPS
jgi:hypothetical protein